MKRILFLSLSLIAITAFISLAQQYGVAPSVQIQTGAAVAKPIQIEVGKDIAKSVQIKEVSGTGIKIKDLPSAAVVVTPPPQVEGHSVHAHAAHSDDVSTPSPTPTPRSTP